MNSFLRAGVLAATLPLSFCTAATPPAPQEEVEVSSTLDLEPEQYEDISATSHEKDWQKAIESANKKQHGLAMYYAESAVLKYAEQLVQSDATASAESVIAEFGINPLDFYHEQLIAHMRKTKGNIDEILERNALFNEGRAERQADKDAGRALIDRGRGAEGKKISEAEIAEIEHLMKTMSQLEIQYEKSVKSAVKNLIENIDTLVWSDFSRRKKERTQFDIDETYREAGIDPVEFYKLAHIYGAKVKYPGAKQAALMLPEAPSV